MKSDIIFHRNTWNWGRSTIIIAHSGCAVVTVSIEDETPRVAWISGLSVHRLFRNNGYGTELLKAAIAEAERMGASEVELSAELNTFPERWYRRLGLEERRSDEKLVILGNEIMKLK